MVNAIILALLACVAVFAQTPVIALTRTTITSSEGHWATSLNDSNGAVSNVVTNGPLTWVAWVHNSLDIKLSAVSASGLVTTYNTGLTAPSNDNHESLSFAIDTAGYFHLVFGMHTDALKYYKSTSPLNPTAWSGPLSMLGTNEDHITFGWIFTRPSNGEIYFTFQHGGGAASDQFAYHYNVGGAAWEALAGTTAGQITNYQGTGTAEPFLNGLPKWDSNGNLWFQWITAYQTGPSCCGPNFYAVGWNGGWVNWSGASQAMPITLANNSPIFSVGASPQPNLQVLNNFSIDASNRFFLPYHNNDGGGIQQEYIAVGQIGGAFTAHQETANVTNPTGFVTTTQAASAISFKGCTYHIYADIYDSSHTMVAVRSCDGFATSTKYTLGTLWNPNWLVLPDAVALAKGGPIQLFYQQTNDPSLMWVIFDGSTPSIGGISIAAWNPTGGGTASAGNSQLGGNALLH